jgi:hypothetical protein
MPNYILKANSVESMTKFGCFHTSPLTVISVSYGVFSLRARLRPLVAPHHKHGNVLSKTHQVRILDL